MFKCKSTKQTKTNGLYRAKTKCLSLWSDSCPGWILTDNRKEAFGLEDSSVVNSKSLEYETETRVIIDIQIQFHTLFQLISLNTQVRMRNYLECKHIWKVLPEVQPIVQNFLRPVDHSTKLSFGSKDSCLTERIYHQSECSDKERSNKLIGHFMFGNGIPWATLIAKHPGKLNRASSHAKKESTVITCQDFCSTKNNNN